MRTELFKTRGGFTLGELLVVFAVVFLLIAAFTPIIRFSNERMDKVECANNLREIGLAMYIYAREHDGRFPSSLKTLYEENYLGDRRTMDCPAAHTQGTVQVPDYIYTPDLSARDRSDLVLVRDRKGNHPKGGGNVLYVDGTVAWQDNL
jgi:prepilin-type processing-associated H-X9-DG protein